jgi:hypothetical protein
MGGVVVIAVVAEVCIVALLLHNYIRKVAGREL